MTECLLALINEENSLSFGDACLYALIGFLIVFIGITIIIFIIWLIGLIMRKTNNLEFLSRIGKKKKTEMRLPEVEDVSGKDEIPDETKAAIVAALMAYYDAEKPECEFRVRRIKRL